MRAAIYRPLPLCLSIAAHLLVLLLLSQHMGSHGTVAQTRIQTSTFHVLKVGLVQSSSSPAMPTPAVPLPDPLPLPQTLPVPPAKRMLRGTADASTVSVPKAADSASLADTLPPSLPPETSSGALPEPRYYLLRELSVRPTVLQDATASLAFEGVPAQTMILRLFINEEGGIDRIATEQSVLPEAHAQQLIDAFSRARFLPGQLDGAPVKSQMRVEVRLESAPQRDVSLQ